MTNEPNESLAHPNRRLIGLDLLRLLAILLVIGRHFPKTPRRYADPWKSFFDTWHRGGWIGVDLFFVLSGFLVSGLLFSEYRKRGRISVGRFYTRRGWKIYPAFYVFIAVSIVVTYAMGKPPLLKQALSEIFFVQSYVRGIWNHTWSLAVEEHFYILLPLVMLLVLKLNRNALNPLRPILYIAACVAVMCLAGRLINWRYSEKYEHITHLFATHLRLDSLFFGVVIAYFYHANAQRFVGIFSRWRWVMIAAGIALLTPAFILELEKSPFIYTAGLTVFYIAGGLLLVGVLLCRMPKRGPVVWVSRIGAYSYSIYLWHRAVNAWGMDALQAYLGYPLRHEIWCGVALVGAIVWGILIAWLIEVPMLRLRDRFFPTRSEPLPAAGVA